MSGIIDWFERDNARSDAILASRSTRWLILRTLLGVAFIVKGISLTMYAAGELPYVFGPLLVVAGVAFAVESVMAMVRNRSSRRTPTGIEHE